MPTAEDQNPDLLPFIGRPARDALAVIGVTRASQLAEYTEKELLALHGVGPKAIRLLREAGVELRGCGKDPSTPQNQSNPALE